MALGDDSIVELICIIRSPFRVEGSCPSGADASHALAIEGLDAVDTAMTEAAGDQAH